MTASILIRDIGPIARLEIPVEPGVVVIRGRNDTGKTTALNAIRRMLGQDVKVTKRDASDRGEVDAKDAFGVKLGLVRNACRSGVLEAVSIEGDLLLDDLVDPKLVDPEAADRHRVRALLRLSGVKADVTTFAGLFGGGIEGLKAVASPKTLRAQDAVDWAAGLHDDCHAAKRRCLDDAKRLEGQAEACRSAGDSLDLTQESDATVLRERVRAAVVHQSQVKQARTTHEEAERKAEEARKLLEQNSRGYSGPSYEEACAQVESCEKVLASAKAAVAELRRQLAEAEAHATSCQHACDQAVEARDAALAHANTLADWAKTIADLSQWPDVSDEELAAADRAVAEAHAAEEQGSLIRAALQKRQEAAVLLARANQARQEAQGYADAAKGIEDVLSGLVASPELFWRNGRLMTMHPERGEVPYHERSDGTRWRMAIDEAVRRVRALGAEKTALLAMSQHGWEGLDPLNRDAVARHAAERGVVIFTAEADPQDLRAEVYQEGEWQGKAR